MSRTPRPTGRHRWVAVEGVDRRRPGASRAGHEVTVSGTPASRGLAYGVAVHPQTTGVRGGLLHHVRQSVGDAVALPERRLPPWVSALHQHVAAPPPPAYRRRRGPGRSTRKVHLRHREAPTRSGVPAGAGSNGHAIHQSAQRAASDVTTSRRRRAPAPRCSSGQAARRRKCR